MRPGTTPTLAVNVRKDISDMGIHLYFSQGGSTLVEKAGDDLTVTTSEVEGEVVTTIETTLAQEDTLRFKPGKDVEVQIRAVKMNGTVAIATTIASIPVKRILKGGVLRD